MQNWQNTKQLPKRLLSLSDAWNMRVHCLKSANRPTLRAREISTSQCVLMTPSRAMLSCAPSGLIAFVMHSSRQLISHRCVCIYNVISSMPLFFQHAKCEHCTQEFVTEELLHSHIVDRHPDSGVVANVLTCKDCSATFTTRAARFDCWITKRALKRRRCSLQKNDSGLGTISLTHRLLVRISAVKYGYWLWAILAADCAPFYYYYINNPNRY